MTFDRMVREPLEHKRSNFLLKKGLKHFFYKNRISLSIKVENGDNPVVAVLAVARMHQLVLKSNDLAALVQVSPME